MGEKCVFEEVTGRLLLKQGRGLLPGREDQLSGRGWAGAGGRSGLEGDGLRLSDVRLSLNWRLSVERLR